MYDLQQISIWTLLGCREKGTSKLERWCAIFDFSRNSISYSLSHFLLFLFSRSWYRVVSLFVSLISELSMSEKYKVEYRIGPQEPVRQRNEVIITFSLSRFGLRSAHEV